MYNTAEENNNLMHWLHHAGRTMKVIASAVVIAYLILILSPTAEVIAAEFGETNTNTSQKSAETELSESFVEAIEKLALLKQLRVEDKNTDAVLGDLNTLKSRIETLDETVMENFATIEADLVSKQLPAVILQRHTDMVNHYKTQNKEFMDVLTEETETGFISDVTRGVSNLIGGNEVTPNEAAGNAFGKFKTKDFKRSHQEFDPNNLPNKALQPDKNNKPKTTKQEFIQAGLRSSPQLTIAALGDFTFNNLEEAADPLYLAESDEVQLTESIKAKAAELDHDAVKIYHWVRNNIEWLPSWGAIQDAELTLETNRGNSMDIASLTISLLRASKIPARYVHGTIEVPVEKYNNWAGGFSSVQAAGNYASSNGIPTTSLIIGGQVGAIRMEHIWVEAATDFHPSRGMKNKDADTWIQLDPSFKQYDFKEGIDVVEISGLDVDQLTQTFIDSGTVNEVEGWSTGFDSAILQQAQEESFAKLNLYISTLDEPTVGDVIGGGRMIIKDDLMLPSSLPNQIVVVGTRYDKLPNALQQRIEFAFQKDILGNLIDTISFPFAKLNNEKVILSFKPATQADQDALDSLIPEGVADVGQLPTSIPSYLVQVLPELKVDGTIVKLGSGMKLGEELPFTTGIKFAGRGYVSAPRTYKVIAGSNLNVNVFAGSVSSKKLESLQTYFSDENPSSTINGMKSAFISSINRDLFMENMFYASSLSYYAELQSNALISSINSGTYYNLSVGYGTFGYEPRVNYFFGVPRGISANGVIFDIPFITAVAQKTGNTDITRNYLKSIGVNASILEHSIIEKFFINEEGNHLEAISAIKAISLAMQQNQKIYTITNTNMFEVLPLLNHDTSVISEIRSSLNIGKEVTVHESPVSIAGGWSGTGYIISDQETGAGAYKISGGQNGGAGILGNFNAADAANIFECAISGLIAAFADFFLFRWAKKVTDVPNGLFRRLASSLGSRGLALFSLNFLMVIVLVGIIAAIVDCILSITSSTRERKTRLFA